MEKKINILLATDYSEAGMSAELYGVQFAQNINSKLYIIHVYDKISYSLSNEPLELAQTKNEIRVLQLNILEQHRDKLFYLLDIDSDQLDCECIVREGKAGKQICKEADKSDIDFIVITANSGNFFKEFFFGNQTWNVIKKASVPVLAVPKNTFFTGIENIVFATEYREGEIPVINFLVQFAKQFNAAITILHIADYVLSEKSNNTSFDNFKKTIGKEISYDKLDIRLANYDNIVTGLNDFCVESKIDILVMSHEKRFFWGDIFNPFNSITRKMTFDTHIPLLSIPDYYNTEGSKLWKLFDFDERYIYEDF